MPLPRNNKLQNKINPRQRNRKPKAEKPKVEKPKEEAHKQEEKETARRTMTTDSNVRIYDEREASDKRKIFDDKEGEYVEFEEV